MAKKMASASRCPTPSREGGSLYLYTRAIIAGSSAKPIVRFQSALHDAYQPSATLTHDVYYNRTNGKPFFDFSQFDELNFPAAAIGRRAGTAIASL